MSTHRDNVPKVENYLEVNILSYTIDDFKSLFHMTRYQFDENCSNLKIIKEISPLKFCLIWA